MAVQTNQSPNARLSIARQVLRWYDANARDLPWRISPKARKAGARADPYAVWLSEVMLQQTTVATVAPRYGEFLKRWPTVKTMASAPLDDVLGAWAGLGYYARARNLHKCARAVADDHGGFFPDTENELRELPGIGAYTAAAIAAIAFDRRAIVIDGNIERIIARLYTIETPLPAAKATIRAYTEEIWPEKRSGDFAQGLMDIGAGICRPKAPACLLCPLQKNCAAYASGRAAEFPVKAKKATKPTRHGVVYALKNSKGEVLFERRPEKGLLGGMFGLPGTPWSDKVRAEIEISAANNFAPAQVEWRHAGDITHTFTHFHLALDVYDGSAPKRFRKGQGQKWITPTDAKIPTVMKKALNRAIEN